MNDTWRDALDATWPGKIDAEWFALSHARSSSASCVISVGLLHFIFGLTGSSGIKGCHVSTPDLVPFSR